MPPPSAPAREPSPPRSKLRRVSIFLLRTLLGGLGLYVLIILVGLIPVNNDFEPTPDGIEILVISTAVHADLVLPIKSESVDWREQFPPACFRGDVGNATHVAIGWGDQGFFIQTPTWADLRFSTAAHALFWPSASCLHVSFLRAAQLPDDARRVRISESQYEDLAAYINASFTRRADHETIQIGQAAYGLHDAFFQAVGVYHCLNTCNSWAGRALRAAGVRTPWLTPLPKTPYLYLGE